MRDLLVGMDIGLSIEGSAPLPEVLTRIERAAADGFARARLSDVGGWTRSRHWRPWVSAHQASRSVPPSPNCSGANPLVFAGQALTAPWSTTSAGQGHDR
jgi:anti-sigma-K factor RskA